MSSDLDIEAYMHAMREASERFAKAKGQLVYMTHFRQALLAKLATSSKEPTVTARENEARASDDYQDFLEGLSAAVQEEALALWELKRAELKIDLWRTQEATKRTEKKGYGA